MKRKTKKLVGWGHIFSMFYTSWKLFQQFGNYRVFHLFFCPIDRELKRKEVMLNPSIWNRDRHKNNILVESGRIKTSAFIPYLFLITDLSKYSQEININNGNLHVSWFNCKSRFTFHVTVQRYVILPFAVVYTV